MEANGTNGIVYQIKRKFKVTTPYPVMHKLAGIILFDQLTFFFYKINYDILSEKVTKGVKMFNSET